MKFPEWHYRGSLVTFYGLQKVLTVFLDIHVLLQYKWGFPVFEHLFFTFDIYRYLSQWLWDTYFVCRPRMSNFIETVDIKDIFTWPWKGCLALLHILLVFCFLVLFFFVLFLFWFVCLSRVLLFVSCVCGLWGSGWLVGGLFVHFFAG